MTPDLGSQILVLCDYDALYAAIELKLGNLANVRVTRLEPGPPEELRTLLAPADFGLIILATLSPVANPMAILANLPHPGREPETPVLVISEQPSKPESDDKITFLNFPFDFDELNHTVINLLDKHPQAKV